MYSSNRSSTSRAIASSAPPTQRQGAVNLGASDRGRPTAQAPRRLSLTSARNIFRDVTTQIGRAAGSLTTSMTSLHIRPDPSCLPASNRSGNRLAAPAYRVDAPSGNIIESFYGGYAIDVDGYSAPVIFNVDKGQWQHKQTGKLFAPDYSATIALEFPRLPELPPRTKPIPKIVHSVWVGERVPDHLLNNLVTNRKKLPKDFQVHLHMDVAPDYFEKLVPILRQHKIRAIDMRQERFFTQSDVPNFNCHYDRLKDIGIFAANSDLVRFPILAEAGGWYMDLDDEILVPNHRIDWFATDDILLGMPTRAMNGQDSHGMMNNTPIAATRGSRLCHAIALEISNRLSDDIALLEADCTAKAREALLFRLTGPQAMHHVISEWMPDVVRLATLAPGREEAKIIDQSIHRVYIEGLNQRVTFYFPFSNGVEIGDEGSWRLPEHRVAPDRSGISS